MNKILTIPVAIIIASIVIASALYFGLKNTKQSKTNTITYEEIQGKVPYAYQIYDFYYVDLDEDGLDEVLVILEEEENYITEETHGADIDGFREKPIEIMVFDLINNVWIATEPTIVSNSPWQGQHLFTPYNYSEPYRIIKKQDKDWLLILEAHASFDAYAISPNIFTYDEKKGLQRVKTSGELWGDNVFASENYIYFTICNPFTNEGIEAYELDLSGNTPKQKEIYLGDKITCDFIWTNSGYGGFINEQAKTEALFNSKGIYFPIN